jgi:glycosyltransferase involved in cell wall biosynthesis
MNVLFLTLYPPQGASARYRVHQFLPALEQAGIACTVACAVEESLWRARPSRAWKYHLHEIRRRREQLKTLDDYRLIFVQKGITSAPVRGMLSAVLQRRDRLVYDIDDAVHIAPPDRLPRPLRWLEAPPPQGLTLMKQARLTLAGNHWLEEQARWQGGHPCYMPTVVDTDRFHPAPQPGEEYRLGWMGSPSTAPALALLGGVLNTQPITLVGAGPVPLPFSAHREPWSMEREVALINSTSVGLMPMEKSAWGLGKCALKALQFMACGRPVIATRWGAAKEVIVDGITGILVDSLPEWRAAIERLRDPAERDRMGRAARAHVEAEFSLKAWAPRMVRYLKACQ